MPSTYPDQPRSLETPTTFLCATEMRINDIKQMLYGINEKLNQAGFYPAPTPAGSNADKPSEANLRSSIDEQLTRTYEVANLIREQVDRIA